MRKFYKEENEAIPGVIYVPEGTEPAGFVAIASVQEFVDLSAFIDVDYNAQRDYIKYIADLVNTPSNWGLLTNSEKEILIDLHIYPSDALAVHFLMTVKGLNQSQSIGYLQTAYSKHIQKDVDSCRKRRFSYELTKTVIKHLSPGDASDFAKITAGLNQMFVDAGVKGLDDGSHKSGLFDFINSTHDFLSAGLEEQGYTLLTGTWESFKYELMDILKYGNYES